MINLFFKMKFGYILLVSFIVGINAYCPTKQDTANCAKCSECRSSRRQANPTKDLWCSQTVCGTAVYSGRKCDVEWKGLCGLVKCDQGVNLNKQLGIKVIG